MSIDNYFTRQYNPEDNSEHQYDDRSSDDELLKIKQFLQQQKKENTNMAGI
jgi:hypothetical protein